MLEPNQDDMPTEMLDMACTCGEEHDNLIHLREDVRRQLHGQPIPDIDFLDQLLYNLTARLRASASDTITDHWHAVRVEYLDDNNERRRLLVACDHILDGYCAIWRELAIRAGIWKDTP